MHNRTLKFLTSCFALTLGLLGTCANAAIVSNGGFETGNFTGWTPVGDPNFIGVDTFQPQSGTFAAFFGNVGTPGSISQTLTTSANQYYTLDFWLMSEVDANGFSAPNSFDVSWGGVTVTSLSDAPATGYLQYTFTLQATSASTALSFSFRNDPAFWDLDSISVTETADPNGTVPEPGSLALVGLAGALAAVVRRRGPAGFKP